jgi:hypothetical protein
MTWDGMGYPGRGWGIAGIAVIRKVKALTTKDTNAKAEPLKPTPIWDDLGWHGIPG